MENNLTERAVEEATTERAVITTVGRDPSLEEGSVQADCITRTRREASTKATAQNTEATRNSILDLAAGHTESFVEEKKHTARSVLKTWKTQILKKATHRARIFGPSFQVGAAPGPSSTIHVHVRMLAQLQGCLDAIKAFAKLEVEAKWDCGDHGLWHAALVEPADCGEQSPPELTKARPFKLRRLALTEVIVKLVETAASSCRLQKPFSVT